MRRAIVHSGLREKRNLGDLGGQKAAGITLTPTTSCSLPGVIGHTLSKLLNTEFALPRIQKNRNVSAHL